APAERVGAGLLRRERQGRRERENERSHAATKRISHVARISSNDITVDDTPDTLPPLEAHDLPAAEGRGKGVLARRAGRERADAGRSAHRTAEEIPAQNGRGPRRGPEDPPPREHREPAGCRGGTRADLVSPGGAAPDDGRVSRRARHRAR